MDKFMYYQDVEMHYIRENRVTEDQWTDILLDWYRRVYDYVENIQKAYQEGYTAGRHEKY